MGARWLPATRSRRSPLQALGWPAAAGVALLALAALMALGMAPQWRAAAEESRLRAARIAPVPAPIEKAPAWPAPAARDARIDRLLELAREHRLRVLAVGQEPPAPGATGASRSHDWERFTLQLEGGYGDLRAYVARTLQADPALALEALRLSRQARGQGAVRADLSLALASGVGVPAP